MFDFLGDNLLIICPNSYKLAILNYLNENKLLLNIKFMTKSEYKKSIKFGYDIDAIHYLKNKNMKVDNAITILDNLYYIEDKIYNNPKLDYLVNIKKELDANNLLIYDNLFSKILKRRKVVVYGYGKLDSYDMNLFSNATIIPYQNYSKKYDIYHLENISDEVEFVFQKICELLKGGVDINNISLMNVDSEYISYIKMMEKFYSIKTNIDNRDTVMGTLIGKEFFDLVKGGKDANEIIDLLKKYEDSSEYTFIINLLNKYSDYSLTHYIDEIKYDLINSKIKKEIYENVVKVKSVFDYVDSREFVFLMNFNSSSIPKLTMDTDYITDDVCSLVGVMTKDDENELIKKNTLDYLSNINNLVISYKDKSPFNEYTPSFLMDDMAYEIKEYQRDMNYSERANRSLYGMILDDLVKYGIKNDNLELLYSNYGKNNYGEYNNEFSGIKKEELLKYLNNELTLSYSSIDTFYKCAFRYYLNNILQVNIFEENFNTIIGNLFHYVLRKMNEDDNFDFDKEYNNFIKDYELSSKEKFFVEKLKSDLEYIVSVIKYQQFLSGLNNVLAEHKIDIKLMNNPYVHFKGFIDKMMYKEKNNETLVSIIDYKTGKYDEVNIKNVEYGLTMQLPSYLYLASHCEELKNIKFTGFYLQRILNLDVLKEKNKTIDELKRNSLKLDGFSTDNMELLSVFDPTYKNSEMIKSMAITKSGSFNSHAKTISYNEINKLIEKTHEKIMAATNDILSGNFLINPKILKGKNKSCEHCDFKDVCYHTEKDLIYLDDNKIDDENI